METIKLTNRLAAAAGFIRRGASAADIGTDHGHLPVYLAQTGIASTVIASDIGAGPLQSARRSAAEYGVTDKIVFKQAAGLEGIRAGDADTVIITGLGGETIVQILSGAPWTKECGVRLILQPQTKADELFVWLYGSGYVVSDAALACDIGRYYVILLAEAGEARYGEERDTLSILAMKRDPLFKDYVNLLAAKTRRALEGIGHSRTVSEEYLYMKAKLERLEHYKKEAEAW